MSTSMSIIVSCSCNSVECIKSLWLPFLRSFYVCVAATFFPQPSHLFLSRLLDASLPFLRVLFSVSLFARLASAEFSNSQGCIDDAGRRHRTSSMSLVGELVLPARKISDYIVARSLGIEGALLSDTALSRNRSLSLYPPSSLSLSHSLPRQWWILISRNLIPPQVRSKWHFLREQKSFNRRLRLLANYRFAATFHFALP